MQRHPPAFTVPVDPISNDRAPQTCKVDANLVLAACLQLDFNQR
jgi:hypothetical protein